MATTLTQITDILDDVDLSYRTRGGDTVLTGFSDLPHYRDADGDPHLGVVLRVHEDGDYVQVFAPNAYRVRGSGVGPVLEACAQIQWRAKLIRFAYDPSDGELRPTVELPLETADLSQRQLLRCVHGLVDLVDRHHGAIVQARDEGVVELPDASVALGEETMDRLGQLLGQLSPEVVAEALQRGDAFRRRN